MLHEAVMGGNMSCLNMIPISTVNLVNSVEGRKEKTVQPKNQSEQLLEVIETTWLVEFFMLEPVGLYL